MPYRPRPSLNAFFESYLKGKAHFHGGSIVEVCRYMREAIKEKMDREPKGYVEMIIKHWKELSEKERNEYENK